MRKLTQILLLTVASCGFVQASNNNENYPEKASRNNQYDSNIPNPERVEQNRLNNLQQQNQQEQDKKQLEEKIEKLEQEVEILKNDFQSQEELKKKQEELIRLDKEWNQKYGSNSDNSQGATFGNLPRGVREKIMFERGMATVDPNEASEPSEPNEISENIPSKAQMERFWIKRQRPSRFGPSDPSEPLDPSGAY